MIGQLVKRLKPVVSRLQSSEYGIVIADDAVFWGNGLAELMTPAEIHRLSIVPGCNFAEMAEAYATLQGCSAVNAVTNVLSRLLAKQRQERMRA